MEKVHFMGLGGAGISAVASFSKEAGFEVSGCDIDPSSPFLKELLDKKIPFFTEHNKNHLDGINYLVISPAIESLDPNNPEVVAAKESNIPVLIGEEFLAKYLLGEKKVIAVSGTHGKSTTTSMIGKILEDAGLDPSVMVGAIVPEWETNYRVGKGDYFVLEADEYQEKFLLYHPYIEVITAIEMDHPEYFKNLEHVKNAFQKFADNTISGGKVVVGENVDLVARDSELLILGKDFPKQHFNLKLIGEFNQENAALAAEVAKLIGIDNQVAKTSLERFSGIGRRFELIGEVNGIKVFDDYGHHPSAIKATVEAAKEKFPNNRIFLVYQPHMFSRTKYLFNEFVEVLQNLKIKETVLVDIYAARQEKTENISSSDIATAVNLPNTKYIGNFEQTVSSLVRELQTGDIVLVMGAGDIYKLSEMLIAKLKG